MTVRLRSVGDTIRSREKKLTAAPASALTRVAGFAICPMENPAVFMAAIHTSKTYQAVVCRGSTYMVGRRAALRSSLSQRHGVHCSSAAPSLARIGGHLHPRVRLQMPSLDRTNILQDARSNGKCTLGSRAWPTPGYFGQVNVGRGPTPGQESHRRCRAAVEFFGHFINLAMQMSKSRVAAQSLFSLSAFSRMFSCL